MEICAGKSKPVTPMCLFRVAGGTLVKRVAAKVTTGWDWSREKQRESDSIDAP